MISVIIPTYRNWAILESCLRQLEKQTLSKDSFEVIIVNNDPQDLLPEGICLEPNMLYLSEGTPGSYAARNTGIRHSKGDVIAFTDSDCLPQPTWLEEVFKEMSSNNEVDLIAGDIQLYKLPSGEDAAFLFEKHYAFQQKVNVERFGRSVTANLIVRKKVFDQVGVFDELTFSGEDNRWTSMAVSKGYRMIYAPRVQVLHPARESMTQLIQKRKRTIGGYYTLHYRSLSFGAKIRSHIIAILAPIKTALLLENASAMEKFRVLMIKWRIEWAAFWELVNLRWKGKEQLRS